MNPPKYESVRWAERLHNRTKSRVELLFWDDLALYPFLPK